LPTEKGRIFISYRRVDTSHVAGRIYDRLSAYFGEKAIFMDVEAIDGGVDFVKVLENAVQSCDVVITLIGRQWLNIKDKRGERRLDNPEDFVRIEIAAALSRDIRVIPVLVDGVNMPHSTELPENLKPLARRNVLQVIHRSFNADANRLISHLERALEAAEESKVLKVQRLKEKQIQAQRQAEIEKLLMQADTTIAVQDWQLAKEKLENILELDTKHIQAEAKLEIVEGRLAEAAEEEKKIERREEKEARERIEERNQAKADEEESRRVAAEKAHQGRLARKKQIAEEKARQDTFKKAQQEERVDGIKRFFQSKGKFITIGIVIFSCIIFGGSYTLSKILGPIINPPSLSEDNCVSEEVLCVGLVTDVGEIDDKSFNQSAWEGVQKAVDEMGAFAKYVETKDAKDYVSNIGLFAEKDYDIIVTVGFAMGQATVEEAAKYPEVDFIGVDQWQAEETANVVGLLFPEDKAGFMAGALAAQMSETGTIAAVLGTDLVPPVVAFKEGFEAGARYINPDINLISTYHPGGMDVAFVDPEWGATTSKQAIDQGADVVFGAGGKTGNGALIEAASREYVLCIGVDTDQWETVPEAHPCLISSAMKLITPSVFDLIGESVSDSFPGGNFNGAVGLAGFHDFDDIVSQAVRDKLAEIDIGLQSGDISTGY